MTEDDRANFYDAWAEAVELYGAHPTNGALALAFAALKVLSIEQVRVGLTAHVRDPQAGRWFPKPADIIRHVAPPVTCTAAIDDAAAVAWERVLAAVQRNQTRVGDPLIDQAMRRVGIARLNGMGDGAFGTENRTFVRRDFVEVYRVFAAAHPVEHARIATALADPARKLSQHVEHMIAVALHRTPSHDGASS